MCDFSNLILAGPGGDVGPMGFTPPCATRAYLKNHFLHFGSHEQAFCTKNDDNNSSSSGKNNNNDDDDNRNGGSNSSNNDPI